MARTNLHRLAHLEYVGTSVDLTIEMAERVGVEPTGDRKPALESVAR